ncbi:mannose-6-phosphate isomerase, class I [Vibrio sp. 1978]|uniref:mannose-6-phosphate isomerase, class I n=1 Tax=Vibrio sp. 1978 TaxID=3074585 RepID=UPI0029669791|nr:mannose-6-phosphate isomerase, class I [Vibrio sp. 1978]MDW3056457.1 mannose-6-phosphate isomerase, class I [Vibrio sp. 1978]
MIYKLNNVVQNYAWGSMSSLNHLFGIENPKDEPQAELWMGAHPNGCSMIEGLNLSLADYLKLHGTHALGSYTVNRYGELPYLFKVLAAQTPLSIQVHPNKRNSEIGFARENQSNIELTAANRNYKDSNHKPELVYAITLYKAMNGFRPIEEIIALFKEVNITALADDVAAFEHSPNAQGLKVFFRTLLTLSGDKQVETHNALSQCYDLESVSDSAKQALQYSQNFAEHYLGDNGLLAPLFLNIVELKPGEAMFLHAETPHAYVQGTALEIMASSDNVLRAGLTPKHIAVDELVANTRFESISPEAILTTPLQREGHLHFPVPVDDFSFDVITASNEEKTVFTRSAEIVFCIEGNIEVSTVETTITLAAGQSAFIPYDSKRYSILGQGRLARACN